MHGLWRYTVQDKKLDKSKSILEENKKQIRVMYKILHKGKK